MAGHKVDTLGVSRSYELAGSRSTYWRISTVLVVWGFALFGFKNNQGG